MALPFTNLTPTPLVALNAVSTVLRPTALNNIKELTFYLVFSAGTDAGAVQCEEAPTVDYAGTWAPIGSAVTFGNDAVKTVKASGVNMFARARVSTLLTNGTVTVYAIGR